MTDTENQKSYCHTVRIPLSCRKVPVLVITNQYQCPFPCLSWPDYISWNTTGILKSFNTIESISGLVGREHEYDNGSSCRPNDLGTDSASIMRAFV